MMLPKTWIQGIVDLQPKYFQRLPLNKNVVQKLKKREGFGLSCELRLDHLPVRIYDD